MSELNELKTNIEVVKYVRDRLMEQGCKSATTSGGCRYRWKDENGKNLKCAAGHLIPDDKYIKEFEGRIITCNFGSFNNKERLIELGFDPNKTLFDFIKEECLTGMEEPLNKNAVCTMQEVHDDYNSNWDKHGDDFSLYIETRYNKLIEEIEEGKW